MPSQQDWLVQTKIQPPLLHADTIERHRLLDALHNAVSHRPVTLVSAPAGYGKTTLLASLPRLFATYQMAWISLDSDDNDPARFLGALIASLNRLHPAVGEGARQHLSSEPRRVVAALINEIVTHLPGPFVLVLDDLHFVTEPRVHAALDFLIERLPPQMRLVIGTRHDPPLALARLIAHRQVAEVRRPHLSFTSDEMRLLLNDTLGLSLSQEELELLAVRTEGWPAGLCLLASSLDRITTEAGRAALLTGLRQTDHYVFDFLASEVLNLQGEEVRSFLLQTCILSQLTPALCTAVTQRDDAALVLEELYRRNLFLVVDESGAYRYHALFAEFLRRQLEREQPALLPDLHRRAAAAHTSRSKAVGHLLAAQLYEEAAQLLEEIGGQLLLQGLADTLANWGAQIPEEVRDRHPQLCSVLGRAWLLRSEYQPAYALTDQARRGFASAGDTENQAVALNTLCSLAMLMGDAERCKELAAQFFAIPGLAKPLRARGLATLVYLACLEGRWEEAASALQESLALIVETADLVVASSVAYRFGPYTAMLPGCLGLVEEFCRWLEGVTPAGNTPLRLVLGDLQAGTELMRGRPAQAVSAARTALALREQLGGFYWLGLASAMYLATVAACRGDRSEADAQLATMARFLETMPPDQLPLWIYGAGRTHWLLGQYEEARRYLGRLQDPGLPVGFHMGPPLQRRLAGLVALSDGRPADALALLREAVQLEPNYPGSMAAGSARVPLIRALVELGRREEAMAEFRTLVTHCREQKMPGLLYQEGTLILPLLRQAAAAEPGGSVAAVVLSLYGEAVTEAASPAAVDLPEPLTERELEVLRLLSGGATNRQIAETLYIGEETVKTHVARTLRKLGAPTRTAAAVKGRELGLI